MVPKVPDTAKVFAQLDYDLEMKLPADRLAVIMKMASMLKSKFMFFETTEINGGSVVRITLGDELETSANNYELFIEMATTQNINPTQFAESIDTFLKEGNIEYDSKQASQRLKPLKVRLLKQGTAEVYKTHCINKGQRESQFKAVLLQYRNDIDFPFEKHCVNPDASAV